RPFSSLNRSHTIKRLRSRESNKQKQAKKAQDTKERGIDQGLEQDLQNLGVIEQMSHPRLQGTPLLSRISKSSNGNGQKMKVVCRLSEAVALIADNDHRAAAASFQGEGLDDAWVFVLASSLETNDTMRSLNLNNNLVGDRGSRALAQSLYLNSHLRMLSLGGNRITDAGASSLADLLRSGICNLTGLDLSGPKPIMTSVGLDEYGVGQSRVVDIIRAPGATALALALDNSLGNPPCPLVTLNLSDQR
ncbi:unnamed protein product, partial [Choristocarpus tenellus]